MAHAATRGHAVWRVEELELDVADVVFVRMSNGRIVIEAAFYAHLMGRRATFSRLDIEGPGPNTIGLAGLREAARAVMELLDVDELRVEGAARTSGAGPGRRPAAIVFRRTRDVGAPSDGAAR